MDSRNPTELSVNRVSTLDNEGAHRLGIEHVENIIRNNPEQKRVYHGFAKLKAQIVYSEKCNIVKDDINGTKPYHANIIYPRNQGVKFDDIELAIVLATNSQPMRYKRLSENNT